MADVEQSDVEVVGLLNKDNRQSPETSNTTPLTITHRQEEQEKYDDILRKAIRKVQIVVVVAMAVPLLGSTRYYVLELYMQSFSNDSTSTISTISTILFAGFMWFALFSFIASTLSDKYGHDNMLLAVFLFNGVGVFIESIANNLSLFTIGFFVNRVSLIPITMAYIAYILPHKYAISYMSRFFTIAAVVYLLGPIIAALIVDLTTYRNVFWLNTILLAVCILLILAFILGSQSKLHGLQRSLHPQFVAQQERDDIFPVCVDEETTASWTVFLKDIGRNQLIVLTIAVVQNSLCWTLESIIIFYYAMYIRDKYRDRSISLVYTSGMVLCMTVSFGVSNIALPMIIARIVPKYLYIVSLSSASFMVLAVVAVMGYPRDEQTELTVLWVLCAMLGVVFGLTCIGTEMCILEMQPKQHSGKVSGAKEALKIVLRALAILLVGQFWKAPQYNSMWMACVFCSALVFVLSFPVFWFVRGITHNS